MNSTPNRNTYWTAIGENDYRLLNEPGAEAVQISETVAILTLDGQAFGQMQSLNHCDKVITLASREDVPTAGESGLYFLHTNQIDTVTLITDQDQNVVWEAIMEPFGEVNVLTEAIENPLRFPGQYFDSETGLYYNWHRYYDPVTGRYITSDPIGLEGGLNTYTYAANSPLVRYDAYGLSPQYCGMKDLYDCFQLRDIWEQAWDDCTEELGPVPDRSDLGALMEYSQGRADLNAPIRKCIERKHPGLRLEYAITCGMGVLPDRPKKRRKRGDI